MFTFFCSRDFGRFWQDLLQRVCIKVQTCPNDRIHKTSQSRHHLAVRLRSTVKTGWSQLALKRIMNTDWLHLFGKSGWISCKWLFRSWNCFWWWRWNQEENDSHWLKVFCWKKEVNYFSFVLSFKPPSHCLVITFALYQKHFKLKILDETQWSDKLHSEHDNCFHSRPLKCSSWPFFEQICSLVWFCISPFGLRSIKLNLRWPAKNLGTHHLCPWFSVDITWTPATQYNSVSRAAPGIIYPWIIQ